MKRILEVSGDGSHTLFVPEVNEHYHSTKGAVQEALHVYLQAGLHRCDKQEIDLLEIGFGTGLNAFLTLLDTETSGRSARYMAIENYPLKAEEAGRLNYSALIDPSREATFAQLHAAPWDEWVPVTPRFELHKKQWDVTRMDERVMEQRFDVIYFDAFGPEKQPEMWSKPIFEQLHQWAREGAVLVTYCAKGSVRRMLQEIGFLVERLPGPPGKREMLRAIK